MLILNLDRILVRILIFPAIRVNGGFNGKECRPGWGNREETGLVNVQGDPYNPSVLRPKTLRIASDGGQRLMTPVHGNTFVVVPAYNEARQIGPVVRELTAAGYEVVVVDDGSADGTAEAVASLPAHLLRHPVNLGQGAALETGMGERAWGKGQNMSSTSTPTANTA